MKIVNFLLAALFLVFAYVQINDPDPLLWILIYLNMVLVCVLAAFKKVNKYWILLSGLIYIVYMSFLFPGAWHWFQSPDKDLLFDDIAKMQNIYIEETREFLGLFICVIVLLFQWANSK